MTSHNDSNIAKAATADAQPLHDRAPCNVCGLVAKHSFVVQAYRLFVCSSCDYAFIDPQTAAAFSSVAQFDDSYFSGGGAGYTNYLDEGRLLTAHGRRYGTMLAQRGVRTVLDVGTAAGFILLGMQQAGCQGTGIEPNASMAGFAARELGLTVVATTLEAFDDSRRFDAVTMLQVVDHLEDIHIAFERVGTLTKPGGWCLIEFGNRASLTARVLGPAWHEYAPPSVQRVFSLRALQRLLDRHGFTLHASGHPKKYLRADHALSLLRYKSPAWFGNRILEPFARAIPANMQLRYIGDDITWALFERR